MKLKLYTNVYLTETSDMHIMKNLDDLNLSEWFPRLAGHVDQLYNSL
jgi:hypothetical protein